MHQSLLHSPSCLQVSWQETAGLPIGKKTHFEVKKQSSFSQLSTQSFCLWLLIPLKSKDLCSFTSPQSLSITEDGNKWQHCLGQDVEKEWRNTEVLLKYDFLIYKNGISFYTSQGWLNLNVIIHREGLVCPWILKKCKQLVFFLPQGEETQTT